MYQNKQYIPDELEVTENYWQTKLAQNIEPISFYTDFPRTGKFEKNQIDFTINADLANSITKLSNNQDILLYAILLSAIKLVVYKYTNQRNIITVSPLYMVERIHLYPDKFVLIADAVENTQTFKEFLITIKKSIIDGYKNQHVSVSNTLKALNSDLSIDSFFNVLVSLDQLHETKHVQDIINSSANDLAFQFERSHKGLSGKIVYNSLLFKPESIETIVSGFITILEQAISNLAIPIKDIEILNPVQRQQLLADSGEKSAIKEITINRWFEEVANKFSDRIACSEAIDLTEIHDILDSFEITGQFLNKIQNCCFGKNRFLFEKEINDYQIHRDRPSIMLKTNRNQCFLVDQTTLSIINLFNGENTISTVCQLLEAEKIGLHIYPVDTENIHAYSLKLNQILDAAGANAAENLLRFVLFLYHAHIIDLERVSSENSAALDNSVNRSKQIDFNDLPVITANLFKIRADLSPAKVLLLGDTPGTSSMGLVYLASFLRRHGITAYAQFCNYNWNKQLLEKNLNELLDKIKPEIVGVSMKWFPHIYRVLEICKIVKNYSPAIKVVVGGDTGSCFANDIINDENVDFVIRGDGEVPLLEICNNSDILPNCTYKKNGQVIQNPISYVQQNESTKDIYLENAQDIFVHEHTSLFTTVLVYTHKGCKMSCFYCGGCNTMQQKIYNRKNTLLRGADEVRNDILELKEKTSAYLFDFDLPANKLYDYCQNLWSDIDLSGHFCVIFSLFIPPAEVVELACRTFKYVRWNIDICSLSESYRKKSEQEGLVKPQPTDQEMLDFFEICDQHENAEVDINCVIGLPNFSEKDIEDSENVISTIISRFRCFKDLHWGRLHTQPGTELFHHPEQYNMTSYVRGYEEFLKYSKLNFEQKPYYPTLLNYNYPYNFYKENSLNAKISKHFKDLSYKILSHDKAKRKYSVKYNNITYRELNEKSNQLACAIRARGIKANSIVAIVLDKPLDEVISILGILKAGGAFLPVDSGYPSKMIESILKDSQPELIITNPEIASKHNLAYNDKILNIDDEKIYENEVSNLESLNAVNDLLYVIYTSGTTGNPKGILVEHKGVVNFIDWRIKEYNFTADDKTLQLLSSSFDGSYTNLLPSLLSGGNLVLLPYKLRRDYIFIKTQIRELNITNLSVVPLIYEMLLKSANYGDISALRFVILAGEQANEELFALHQKKNPETLLINEYGPTENSITSTIFIGLNSECRNNIGKPVANVNAYILNNDKNLLPVGVPGELHLAGIGLARGYINKPLMTSEKFIDNPFEPATKIYKTGDIAKRLTDGNLQYIGRDDQQVKIRGHRVELGEIKHQLLALPDIDEAIVVHNTDMNSASVLEAYIISIKNLDALAIRRQLMEYLPDYMIPSSFIQIDEFPVTSSGKIDINQIKLIQPKVGNKMSNNKAISATENTIYEIWRSVLSQDSIGLNDNFFELGGNSAILMQVHSSLDQKYPDRISVPDLFTYPTIRSLAEFIEKSDIQPAQNISFNYMTLPAEYFCDDDIADNDYDFSFNIDNDLYAGLRDICQSNQRSINEVLVSLFILLVSKISNDKKINIYSILNETDQLAALQFDSDNKYALETILNALKQQHDVVHHHKMIPVNHLLNSKTSKEQQDILLLFYNKALLTTAFDFTTIFDIVLEVQEGKDRANLLFLYNMARIREDKIDELATAYLNLIHDVVFNDVREVKAIL